MPIEVEVVLNNGGYLNYYIPTVLMRGEKEIEATTKLLEDWAWTSPTYSIFLKHKASDIFSVKLHPNSSIADVEPLNDNLVIPTKWNWDKYDLKITLVKKRKKGKVQKLMRIKK